MKWKVGNVEIKNQIVLAPMAGISNTSYRQIIKEMGAGLIFAEMVSDKALVYGSEKTFDLLKMNDMERPIAQQIFGSDVDSFVKAAKLVEDAMHPDIIDINMGCPAPKVTKNGDGSKLLLDLDKVYEIVKAVVEVSTVPITVKIRKGWDQDHIVAVEAAKIIEKAGASAITIHGRTRSEFYSGNADWDIIRQIKDAVNIPVIGNGDVKTPEDAKKMIDETQCDGVMISRGSLGNPWIFEQVNDYLENGKYREISLEEKEQNLLQHIELEVEEKGENTAIKEMRKHVCYYIKGEKDASEFRNRVNHLETKEEVFEAIKKYFNSIKE